MAKETGSQDPHEQENDEVIRTIARRLAEARKKRGITQKELGQIAGVAQSRIFELEQGTANVTVRTLLNMSRLLDISPRNLFPEGASVEEADVSDSLARVLQLADDILKVMKTIEERPESGKKLGKDVEAILQIARALAGRRVDVED